MIPLVDLQAQYLEIKDEIDEAISSCISGGAFVNGKIVSDFENDFTKYIGLDYCIGCGNGTDALEIIMQSLNIGSNDEVLVPALSWISTAEAVNNIGAEPVFVDINPSDFTIDSTKIEEKITSKTRAIIPVHLYGCPCDMDDIVRIAEKYGLYIIEDCAQAHGAGIGGRKIGTFGIASAFSFFPSKNLGAFGDAGAIVTGDKEIAEKARRITNHGQLQKKHSHSLIGRNSRLDSLQASVLKVKLRYLDNWNKQRNDVALNYSKRLSGDTDLILPEIGSNKFHVFHLFVVRCKKRAELIEILDKNRISWGIHYPNAIPFLNAYSYKGHILNDFPIAARTTLEILSLPIYPQLDESSVNFICEKILG